MKYPTWQQLLECGGKRSATPQSKALLFLILLALTAPLRAQDADDSSPWAKNRVGLSYRLGLNVRASFRHLGGIASMGNPGSAAPGQDHTYDDGYVKNDSAAGDGYTWNWGYVSKSQISGDSIVFHSGSQGDGELNGITSDPQHGMELNYERWLGRVGQRGNWGLAVAFDYLNIGIRSDDAVFTSTLTDTYALNGIVPPEAPYSGSFSGPPSPGTGAPLISDAPTRTYTKSALVTGRHELNADLFGFKVGPYIEFPIVRRLTANFSAGLAFAVVSSDFRFNETASVAGAMIGSASGSNSRTDILFGPYASANLYYALDPRWSLALGAEYQALSDFKQSAGGREAKLDFSSGVFLKAGLNFSF